MGQEFPLKLGQRGQDAREEVPMRTPKRLYAHERIIYQPELLTCPHCGDLLVMCNYLAWDKTVQLLDRVLSVASRPGCCRHATCAGSRMRLLSAEGQGIALPGSTYGYDVLVRIGWRRQEYHATYREIHAELASQVRISESHVGYLYQQASLPLLACHERQHRAHLAQIATAQGGLIIALDGLAPQGGEPQIWFIRELTSGVTLRSGWLSQQDQPTFEAFLAPLKHLEWPILAVVSDKQKGLVPAVATVLPHTRYLLTLKGRPPFRLAGMETYERLQNVARLSLDLLATRYESRLAQLYQGLQSALSPFTQTYQEVRQGAAWLRDIAYILEPAPTQPIQGAQVAGQLRGYLDTVLRLPDVTPSLYEFGLHLDKVSRSYWPGLFHCYDVPSGPRTNNELESRFRDTGRRLLRTTGQKGLTQRTLQRQGAWELLPRPPTEAQLLGALCHTPPEDLAQERQRFAAHRQRFRLQSRSLRQTQAQFNQLRRQWSTLQPTGTG